MYRLEYIECWVCGGKKPLKLTPRRCALASEGKEICADCCEHKCSIPHLCPNSFQETEISQRDEIG